MRTLRYIKLKKRTKQQQQQQNRIRNTVQNNRTVQTPNSIQEMKEKKREETNTVRCPRSTLTRLRSPFSLAQCVLLFDCSVLIQLYVIHTHIFVAVGKEMDRKNRKCHTMDEKLSEVKPSQAKLSSYIPRLAKESVGFSTDERADDSMGSNKSSICFARVSLRLPNISRKINTFLYYDVDKVCLNLEIILSFAHSLGFTLFD